MEPLNRLTAETILSDEVLSEVFDQEDELYKARLLLSLEDRAEELNVKRKFQELVNTISVWNEKSGGRKKSQRSSRLSWITGQTLQTALMDACSAGNGLQRIMESA